MRARPKIMMKPGKVERRWSHASWTVPSHCDLLIGLMPHLHLLTCIGLHTQFFCAHILGPLPPPHISAHVRPRPPTSAHVNDARFSSVPGGS